MPPSQSEHGGPNRSTIRDLVRSTSYPPFTWLYAAIYAFARWLAVDRLRVTRGVVAVYQAGNVTDPPEWGRSDIDLVVVVDDPSGTIAARVVELLRFLHSWLPMVESPERAGVLRLQTLSAELAASPFLQWRLGAHRRKRLLWGRDVLASHAPSSSPVDLARAEIGWWWAHLWEQQAHGRPQADGYLVHKLVAGVWRAVHWAQTAEVVEPRAGVLALPELAAALPPALLACARARAPASMLDLWTALHRMTLALAGPQPTPAPASDDDVEALLRPRGARLVALDPDHRPDAPGEARDRLVSADGSSPFALRGLRVPGARLAWSRDGLRWPIPADEPPVWPTAQPERFGLPLDEAATARVEAARTRALQSARELARTGALFALDGPALLRLARFVGEHLRGDPRALVGEDLDPEQAPVDLPLTLHQPLTLAVAEALGHPWPAFTPLRMSVLIITRNRAELLRTALAALTRQTRPPDEVVVVDNGSSDATPEVIQQAASLLPIRHVHEPIPGIPRARNAAAAAATGDVLCYTDDDAQADPGWLAALEDRFQRDPRIGLVGGETLPDDTQPGLIARFFHEYMGSEVSP